MTSATRVPPSMLYSVLFTGLFLVAAAALFVGPGDLGDEARRAIYLELRGARLAAAFLAGAGLSVSGVLVQGLFRNPLASPSILGTTSGAMLGGQTSLLFFEVLRRAVPVASIPPEVVLSIGCLTGAFGSLVILLFFLRTSPSILVLLLTGFILSSLFVSLGGFVTAMAQETWEVGRAVVAFSLGSVSNAGREAVLLALPMVLIGVGAAYGWGRSLDVLLSGEDEATTLGVDVRRVQYWAAAWVSVLAGAAVSLGGAISFVGLVVPHALRPYTGVGHRRLIPAAALLGGAFVVTCDVVIRLIPARSEVPLGVVTGLIGAPIFLWLLLRAHREAPNGL